MNTEPRPPGYTSVTPFLVVKDAHEAIDFFTRAFEGTLTTKVDGPDGSISHAEIEFDAGRLQLADKPLVEGFRPPTSGSDTHSFVFYCADVDSVMTTALQSGATEILPISDFPSGDRIGVIRDPSGHRWALMTRIADVPAHEAEELIADWVSANPTRD